MTETIGTLASLALAGSLAVERLVTIVKTVFPSLSEPTRAGWGESDVRVDQVRRLLVLLVTIVTSQATAFFVTSGDPSWEGQVMFGPDRGIPWPLFGLLISGGSAFWTSVVSYASALKDVQKSEVKRAEQREQRGWLSTDAPVVALPPASVVKEL